METYHINHNDIDSDKAQWSQIDKNSDAGSVDGDTMIDFKNKLRERLNDAPNKETAEQPQGELADSLSLFKNMLNPFTSFVEYLSKHGYIEKAETRDSNSINSKLLYCAEEL